MQYMTNKDLGLKLFFIINQIQCSCWCHSGENNKLSDSDRSYFWIIFLGVDLKLKCNIPPSRLIFWNFVYILCTLIALDALAKFSKRWPNKYLWMATVLVRTYTNFLLTFYWAFSTFEIKIFATLYHMKYSTQYTIGRKLSQNIQNSFNWLWETCSDEGNKRLILR